MSCSKISIIRRKMKVKNKFNRRLQKMKKMKNKKSKKTNPKKIWQNKWKRCHLTKFRANLAWLKKSSTKTNTNQNKFMTKSLRPLWANSTIQTYNRSSTKTHSSTTRWKMTMKKMMIKMKKNVHSLRVLQPTKSVKKSRSKKDCKGKKEKKRWLKTSSSRMQSKGQRKEMFLERPIECSEIEVTKRKTESTLRALSSGMSTELDKRTVKKKSDF